MKGIFGSKKELEGRIVELENIVDHLKHKDGIRKRLAQEGRDECIQREVEALENAERNNVHILIDYQGKIRYVSKGYLKLSGYTPEEVTGRSYLKLLKGDSKEIRNFFENPQSQTREVIITGKHEEDTGKYNEIHVTATTHPVFSYSEEMGKYRVRPHTLRPNMFTRVSFKKKKVKKISGVDEKKERDGVSKRVKALIKRTNRTVDDQIKAKKKKKK
jgi:PAS domain S-box-containing protein